MLLIVYLHNLQDTACRTPSLMRTLNLTTCYYNFVLKPNEEVAPVGSCNL